MFNWNHLEATHVADLLMRSSIEAAGSQFNDEDARPAVNAMLECPCFAHIVTQSGGRDNARRAVMEILMDRWESRRKAFYRDDDCMLIIQDGANFYDDAAPHNKHKFRARRAVRDGDCHAAQLARDEFESWANENGRRFVYA